MNHVNDTSALDWKPFEAGTLQGYSLKPQVIGGEYTDAYSADLVRIEPGGFSASHVDKGRHAFYILQGTGRITLDAQAFELEPGSIVKVLPGVAHEMRNTGDAPLVLLALYDPPRQRKLDSARTEGTK
jgi:quercetin dioxygenase-like cupin family protein